MSPIRRPALPLLVSLAALALAAPAAAKVQVTTNPGLQPSFRAGAHDYVTRCADARRVRVKVHATGQDRVSVAGRKAAGGDFSARVRRKTGESFVLRVDGGGRSVRYHVRCLPHDFPAFTVERHAKPQAQWYVTSPKEGRDLRGYVAIFDSNGAPVWWRHATSYIPWDAKLLPDGNLAWTRNIGNHFGVSNRELYEEHTFDGHLVRRIRAVGNPTDTHDLQQLPNGDYMVDVYRPRDGVDMSAWGGPKSAKVFDGEIQEISPSGKLVWSWSTKGHISVSETTPPWRQQELTSQSSRPPGEHGYDYAHINSVEPDGDGFVLSFRHLDAVYRIDKQTGKIDWKLGGTKTPQSLRVRGTPKGKSVFGGQHDARLYDDGTLTVHDNGSQYGRPPAAVRFRIDTANRTATRIEHVTEPDVHESDFVGSARKLAGGDWVVSWGGTPLVTEQRPSGAIVLGIHLADDDWSYRAQPIPPHVLSATTLRRGMDRIAARRWRTHQQRR